MGTKCNVQIALYVYARFLDLKESEKLERPVLATNTRLSTDAQRYADCVGMEVLGWNSPPGNGIESIAEKHRLFPVTMMEMRLSDQENLLVHGFILVNDSSRSVRGGRSRPQGLSREYPVPGQGNNV